MPATDARDVQHYVFNDVSRYSGGQSVGEISEGGGKHTHAEGKFRVHIPRGAFHRGFGDRLEN